MLLVGLGVSWGDGELLLSGSSVFLISFNIVFSPVFSFATLLMLLVSSGH